MSLDRHGHLIHGQVPVPRRVGVVEALQTLDSYVLKAPRGRPFNGWKRYQPDMRSASSFRA